MSQRTRGSSVLVTLLAALSLVMVLIDRAPAGAAAEPAARPVSPFDDVIARNAQDMMAQGRQI